MIQHNKSKKMEAMVKEEQCRGGVPEQPAGVLQIINGLENIAEQMLQR